MTSTTESPRYLRPTAAALSKVRAVTPRGTTRPFARQESPSPRSHYLGEILSQPAVEYEAELVRSAVAPGPVRKQTMNSRAGVTHAESNRSERSNTAPQIKNPRSAPSKVSRGKLATIQSPRERRRLEVVEQKKTDRATAEQERWRRVLGEGNRQQACSLQKQPSKSGERADRDRHDRSERGERDSTGRPLSVRGDRSKRTDGRPLSDRGDRPKRTEGHQRPLISPRIPEQRHIAEGKRQEQSYHSERGHSRVSDSEDYDSAMSTATDIDNEVAPTVQDLGMRNSGGGLAVSGGSSRGNGRVGNVNMMGLVPKLWEKGSTPTGTPKVTPRSTDEIVQARARSRSNEKDSRHAGRSQERPNSKRNESGRSKEREGDLASLAAMPGQQVRPGEKVKSSALELQTSVLRPYEHALLQQQHYQEQQQQRRLGGAVVQRATPSFVAYIDISDSDMSAPLPKSIAAKNMAGPKDIAGSPTSSMLAAQVPVPEAGGRFRRGPLSPSLSAAYTPPEYTPSAAPSSAASRPSSRQLLSDFWQDSEAEEAMMTRLSEARQLSLTGSMKSSSPSVQSVVDSFSGTSSPVVLEPKNNPANSDVYRSISVLRNAELLENFWRRHSLSVQSEITRDHLDFHAPAREKLARQLLLRERREEEMRQHLQTLMSAEAPRQKSSERIPEL